MIPTSAAEPQLAHHLRVLAPGPPGQERQHQRRVERPGLVLDAVALAVEVRVLVGVARLHRPVPRLDVLVEDARRRARPGCSRSHLPMLRFSRPERFSSAGVCSAPHAATTARERTVTGVAVGGRAPRTPTAVAALDHHLLDLGPDEDPGAGVGGVLQPRLRRRALRAAAAAEPAAPAVDALVALRRDVADDRLDVPAELAQPALHDAVARAARRCARRSRPGAP